MFLLRQTKINDLYLRPCKLNTVTLVEFLEYVGWGGVEGLKKRNVFGPRSERWKKRSLRYGSCTSNEKTYFNDAELNE